MYLSGPRAQEVAACFAGSPLQTPDISERIGAASALTMGYAAYTKGTTALLTSILGMVEKEGVRAEKGILRSTRSSSTTSSTALARAPLTRSG